MIADAQPCSESTHIHGTVDCAALSMDWLIVVIEEWVQKQMGRARDGEARFSNKASAESSCMLLKIGTMISGVNIGSRSSYAKIKKSGREEDGGRQIETCT